MSRDRPDHDQAAGCSPVASLSQYVTRILLERGHLMAARLPHERFRVCDTTTKKGNTMPHRDSQVVREIQRRWRRPPPPVQALRRPHTDCRSSSVSQVGHGQRPMCAPWWQVVAWHRLTPVSPWPLQHTVTAKPCRTLLQLASRGPPSQTRAARGMRSDEGERGERAPLRIARGTSGARRKV